MMKISKIEVIPVVLEAVPYVASYGSISQYRNVIVRVQANDVEGWGEASPWLPNEMGQTQGTVLEIINNYLKPALIGEDPRGIAKIHGLMDSVVSGHPIAKAAIDMALHDLLGKYFGVRVCTLLGGCLRESFPTMGTVGIKEPKQMASDVASQAKDGYRMLKVKLPGSNQEDPIKSVERVKLIREKVGKDIILVVDLNQGWITPSVAIRAIKRIEDDSNLFIEQPILSSDYDGLVMVARSVQVPIIADESAFTERGVMEIIKRGAPRIINVKTTRPGGLYKALKIINLAIAGGIQCQVDDVSETRISSTASAHLASCVPEEFFFYYAGAAAHWCLKKDIVGKGGIHEEKGIVTLPDGPGLGIEIDEKVLKSSTVQSR